MLQQRATGPRLQCVGTIGVGMDERTDVEAFAAEHGDALMRFAFLASGGRGAEAEDAVQEVMLRLTERGLAGIADPMAYCRRAVLNEQKSVSRRAAVALRALPRLVDIARASEPTPLTDERQALLHALRQLRRREREAVVLRYFEDLDDEQIADVLGCSRSTVRSLVHRALPRLKALLDSHADTRTSHAEETS